MHSQMAGKQLVFIAIFEGADAWTEKNFFEGFVNWIEGQFQKIIFIVPFALDGNLKNGQELLAPFYKKLKFTIENTIGERVNYSKYKVSIFCIWDKPK